MNLPAARHGHANCPVSRLWNDKENRPTICLYKDRLELRNSPSDSSDLQPPALSPRQDPGRHDISHYQYLSRNYLYRLQTAPLSNGGLDAGGVAAAPTPGKAGAGAGSAKRARGSEGTSRC